MIMDEVITTEKPNQLAICLEIGEYEYSKEPSRFDTPTIQLKREEGRVEYLNDLLQKRVKNGELDASWLNEDDQLRARRKFQGENFNPVEVLVEGYVARQHALNLIELFGLDQCEEEQNAIQLSSKEINFQEPPYPDMTLSSNPTNRRVKISEGNVYIPGEANIKAVHGFYETSHALLSKVRELLNQKSRSV